MAYDEQLADRVRDILNEETPTSDRKMFGALVFMVEGNMCCGVTTENLLLRLGPEGSARALERPHVQPMTMRDKTMRGFVLVEPQGFAEDAELSGWLEQALDLVRTLPPK